jgi:hypothetical protein
MVCYIRRDSAQVRRGGGSSSQCQSNNLYLWCRNGLLRRARIDTRVLKIHTAPSMFGGQIYSIQEMFLFVVPALAGSVRCNDCSLRHDHSG